MLVTDAIELLDGRETNIRFKKLVHICEGFFGAHRRNGSHHIFKVWFAERPINLQPKGNKAKPEQVKAVVKRLKQLRNGELRSPHLLTLLAKLMKKFGFIGIYNLMKETRL